MGKGDWLCPSPGCLNNRDGVFASKTECPKCGSTPYWINPETEAEWLEGHLKSWDLERDHGFLSGQQVWLRFHNDVFLHGNQLRVLADYHQCPHLPTWVGSTLGFYVQYSREGKPQARDLHWVR